MTDQQRKHAWMVPVAFGVASEVWMYRQASLMDRMDLTVMTNRHDHPETFPAKGFDLQVVKGRWRLPRHPQIRRTCLYALALLNRTVPGFAASRRESHWWLEQISRRRPDVLLAQFGPMAMQLLPLARHAKIPIVALFHGYDLSLSLQDPHYCEQIRRSSQQIDAYVVCAAYMRDALLDLGVHDHRIHEIPYGVPLPPQPETRRHRDDVCQFIMVGRLVDKKRPDLVIRAFASAVAKHDHCKLLIIGEGPLLEQCQELAKTLGVDSQIEFAGRKPPSEVMRMLEQADVFVQHSVTAADGNKEGWPVAVAEAASMNLPILSTLHASIPQQVPHGVAGLLCKEGDWEAMADNMKRMAAAPSLRQKMGDAGRSHISKFDVRKQVQLLEEVAISVCK